MHIQQVKIKNFRCFEDLTVNLNPDVNIFVGNNGSGKSAVLDAISAAMYPYIYELQNNADREYTNQSRSPLFQSDLPIKKHNGNQKNIVDFSILTNNLEAWGTSYRKGVTDNPNEILHMEHDIRIRQKVIDDINALENSLQSELFVVVHYNSNRNVNTFSEIKNISTFDRFDALKNAFDPTANLEFFNTKASFTDLVNWFFLREFEELRDAKNKGDINLELHDLKQIRRAISTIIAPNARVYFVQKNSAQLMVEWETETGEKIELSVNQLSSGYRNMLALVMDFARRLAQANPQMENPLEAEAILMIDELDLHLHPTWQQKIIPDLRKVFPNTQIIATTHSPEIVTTVQRHQVKILEDYQIKECPSPTRGMKSSDVVRYVLGLDNLRPNTEESRTLTALFEAIDNGNLEEAKRLRDKLQDWKSFDPDITRADMQIRRLEREMTA